MSKKLASGADHIVLDVKVGSGAFMKDVESASVLASAMVRIGKLAGRDTVATLTNMEQPLGCAVGNSLEVIEAIETLKGNGPKDLTDLCLHIASEFLLESKKFNSYEKAHEYASEVLYSLKALDKFKEFVKYQKGNPEVVNDYSLFKQPKYKYEITSTTSGTIKLVKALAIGHASMLLGGGRVSKEDVIDMSAGIVLNKKTNNLVNEGDVLATCYTDKIVSEETKQLILNAFVIE